ncbi:MAG: hypothetical protein M1289_01965 [Patescibacteria group bacterium]|nr:hypothetical protein [Patescibacteria group bacterium]
MDDSVSQMGGGMPGSVPPAPVPPVMGEPVMGAMPPPPPAGGEDPHEKIISALSRIEQKLDALMNKA